MEMPGSRLSVLVEVGAAACSKAAAALGQGTVTDNCYCVLTGGGNALNRMLETGLQVCLKLSKLQQLQSAAVQSWAGWSTQQKVINIVSG